MIEDFNTQLPTEDQKPEKKVGRPKNPDIRFPYDEYYEDASYIETEIDPKTKQTIKRKVKKELLKVEYQRLSEVMKCKIRCAKAFDVTLDVLEKAYVQLNGKKIDGIYVNDFFDRFGYSDGNKSNRHQVVEKWKLSSIHHFEVAEMNLKEILHKEDVVKAYNSYMQKYLIEKDKKEFEGQLNF